jgi:hypothetical protein
MVLMRTGEMFKVGAVYSTTPDILLEVLGVLEYRGHWIKFCGASVEAMVRHTRTRTRRFRGAGYVTSQQMFDPDVLPPHTNAAAVSTAPTDLAVRPVLNSTFKVGGRGRASRRYRGGFSPSIMGPFLRNAQQAIVPLALYSAYHLMPKKGRNIFSIRKSARKSRSPRK